MARTIALYISLFLLLISCSDSQVEEQNLSISALRNFESNSRSILISESITLQGYVVANDKYGEFYNSIIIEDGSDAVKILVDMEENYRSYPFGAMVTINCSGLYLLNHYGALTLGAYPTDDYTLDYISQSKIGQYLKWCETPDQAHEPLQISLGELTTLHSLRYVEIEDLLISGYQGVSTYCQRDSLTGRTVATTHTLSDLDGNLAELSVNRLCEYSDEPLPTQPTTLNGIVGYYQGVYSLTITNGLNY